jgi:formamidopyrimidine-DNA glycosylase
MPELPEVETVARQLEPHLVGRRVKRLTILDDRLRTEVTPRVGGRRVVAVKRSGKRVLVEFSALPGGRTALYLAVHLRMTGRLLWVARPGDDERHLRARFELDRGQLQFVDTRRFGTFDWYRDAAAAEPSGLDPLSAQATPAAYGRLLKGSSQSLKPWLLRQDRLVGLGNIYASEILFAARILPERAAGSLGRAEIGRLARHTRSILERAIVNCGTTFSDFQDAHGVEGSYQAFLAVYDREGERCRRCRSEIRRLVQQQRSTYYCAGCQR